MPRYAELDVATNFSFLSGGSHPEELVATSKALATAIAVTDANTLAGWSAPILPPRRWASSSSRRAPRSARCPEPARLSD